MPGRRSYGRKISRGDRGSWRKNALKGTKKWQNTPHEKRVEERKHPTANWGFAGKSPHTLDREEEVQIKRSTSAPKASKEIDLRNAGEVKYAHSIGAIRIDKKGGITPVKGRTRVKNGKLYYVTGKQKSSLKGSGRHITKESRKASRENALKGTKKWEGMSHEQRVQHDKHPSGNWGFEGKSPSTKDRA